jgi:hypothetical protein
MMLDFIVSANLRRRHLNPGQLRKLKARSGQPCDI